MADYPLTDAQIMRLAHRVRGLIRSESKSVPEVPMVDTLEGIESFPVVQTVGGVSRFVRAPVFLISQPAWDAVKGYIEELQTAIGKVEAATLNAETATQDAQNATTECREETEKSSQTIATALETLEGFRQQLQELRAIVETKCIQQTTRVILEGGAPADLVTNNENS